MKTRLALTVLSLGVLLTGCENTPTTVAPLAHLGLRLDMTGAPPAVTQVAATLTRDGFDTQTIALSIAGNTAAGSFDNVAVGVWHLKVDALDSQDVVLFTGETDVEVLAGAPTNVDLVLNPAAGSITVNVRWGSGAAGNALHLDGLSGYAEALDSPSLDSVTDAITMEAWCRPADQYYNTVLSKGSKNYTIELAEKLPVLAGHTRPGFIVRGPTIDYTGAQNYSGRLLLYDNLLVGQWVHVALTWSQSDGIKVYLNGTQVYATTATGSLQPLTDNLRIGARVDPTYTEYFKGDIDEVRIWNVVRSGAEIAANHDKELTGSEAGLVAYWKFNEAAGSTVAHDATANGNDATVTGGAAFIASGAF